MALTGDFSPVQVGERPPCVVRDHSEVFLPEVPTEKPSCRRETLAARAKMSQEMSAMEQMPQEMPPAIAELPAEVLPAVSTVEPPTGAGNDPNGVELPPHPGKWGTCPMSLQIPAEQPSGLVPEGSCLIHNSQEERGMNHLDPVLGQELGSEGFIHQHSHHRLLVHQLPSCPTNSTTMKDAYRPPHRVHLLGQGQRKAMLESMLYQKYREEMLEEIHPRRMPMESVSTTHRDYCAGGYQSTPLPTSQFLLPMSRYFYRQPHNYCMDQPCSFWLEQARGLLGATSNSRGDSAFRRNAAFSTPITESLEQPPPCASLGRRLWPHKQ